ncbi:MAG: multicopper oxidase domain-containing protein [Burkholderiaceae bacterium]
MTSRRDTPRVSPRETLVAGFVADNPGDWLIHCHIVEYHARGMGTQLRVTT